MRAKKGIYIFFDGTGNSYEGSDGLVTNIKILDTLIHRARAKDLEIDGLVDYQTYYVKGIATSGDALKDFNDSIHATSLDDKLAEAYVYVMQHYLPGDRIYLFGFSRGAYTARAFAGVLRRCGVLSYASSLGCPLQRTRRLIAAHKKENFSQYYATDDARTNLGRVTALPRLTPSLESEREVEIVVDSERERCSVVRGGVEFVGLFDTVMGPKFTLQTEMQYDSFCDTSFIKRSCHIIAAKPTVPFTPISFHIRDDAGLARCLDGNVGSHWEYRATSSLGGDHCDIGGGWVAFPHHHPALSNHYLRDMLRHLDPVNLLHIIPANSDTDYPVSTVTHSIDDVRDMRDYVDRWILYKFMNNRQDFPVTVSYDDLTGEEVTELDKEVLISMAHKLFHLTERDHVRRHYLTTFDSSSSNNSNRKRKNEECDSEEVTSSLSVTSPPPPPPLTRLPHKLIHPLDDLTHLKQAIDFLKANFLLLPE